MSEISEFDKIHNYVTWPDREREFFPNGDVTIGALGFPAANESGVANDGTCDCAEGVDECEMPRTVSAEFSVAHPSTPIPDDASFFKATTHVDVVYKNSELAFIIPAKKIDYVRSTHTLTVSLFDDITNVGSYTRICLIKNENSKDPLTTTKLINEGVTLERAGNALTTTGINADNSFDLPEITEDEIDSDKFAVSIVFLNDADVYVYLTDQKSGYENGVYEIKNGTMSYVAASIGDDEMSDADRDELLADGKTMDNVGTCCGPHFRKTYSHDEIHDYVYKKVGAVTGFGVYSDVSGCQGSLVDWLTSSGLVDIGNRRGFPVYVNGFGLGSFYVGQSATVSSVTVNEESDDDVETIHPWLLWSYGTTKNEETDTNVSALPRDWPFTYASGSFNHLDDVSSVTLVKHGVTIDGFSDPDIENPTFGNLYDDIYDEEDPDNPRLVAHRFYNKHHFVLNQKYKRDADGGYEVKPFFIQLPAPLDTEDGDTYEITVSIQNQPEDNLGEFVNAKDLSAYYAAMSQPRVYVMGGRQQFSNKKLPITSITYTSDGFTIVTNRQACDVRGDALPVDTQVRANVTASLNGYNLPSFNAFGQITATSVDGTTIVCEGKIPADRNYHRDDTKFFICGMAYLGEDDNPSTTRMGLVRDSSLFRGDTGSGTAGALDQYNNFYSIDEKDGHRSLPHVDRRYYLASVYQTATNTFPWRMNGRRKMQRLDRVGTDITGDNSIIKMVYEANVGLLHDARFETATKRPDGGYALAASETPLYYSLPSTSWKNIASVLRVAMAENLKDKKLVTEPYGNPVRQAASAMKKLTNDLYNMRLLITTAGLRSAEVTTQYLSIKDRTSWPTAGETLFDSSDINYGLQGDDSIRSNIAHSTLRSLPDYVVKADLYEDGSSMRPLNSDGVLFTEEGDSQGHGSEFFNYYQTVPYTKYSSQYASTRAAAENDCDLVGDPLTGRIYSDNSLVNAVIVSSGNLKSKHRAYNDMRRYADVGLRLEISDSVVELTNENLADWLNPFTNLSYKDGAPALAITTVPTVSDEQQQWFAFDAVQMYRFMMDDDANDPVESISTCMPYLSGAEKTKSKALAKFIEKYVVSHGAGMPIHFYNGRRIELQNGVVPASNTLVYINNIYRMKKRLEAEGCSTTDLDDFLTHYIDDNFASVTSSTRNPNADSVDLDLHKFALAATVPPYKTAPEYTQGNTYTRVRMQFTFSQRAGRWYTTEYRQYPCCYLTPLYGNDALVQRCPSLVDDDGVFADIDYKTGENAATTYLWRNSACTGFNNYRNAMYAPYSSYPPMDITLGCVPYLFEQWPYREDGTLNNVMSNIKEMPTTAKPVMTKLEEPWIPYEDGGISLYPPADVDGGHKNETDSGVHANFWSVRKFVRPATSMLDGCDIPRYEDPDNYDETVDYRSGGLDADPTLYRMFDFPKAGKVEYHLPSQIDPSIDMALNYLYYRSTPAEIGSGMAKQGVIKSDDTQNIWLGYGVSDADQQITDD